MPLDCIHLHQLETTMDKKVHVELMLQTEEEWLLSLHTVNNNSTLKCLLARKVKKVLRALWRIDSSLNPSLRREG